MTRRFAPPRPGREIALLHDAEELLGDIGGGGDLRATTIQLFQIRVCRTRMASESAMWFAGERRGAAVE
jgi:hypothetical protein